MDESLVLDALSNIVNNCRGINKLLEQDQHSFKSNNIKLIKESDQIKNDLLEDFQKNIKTICDTFINHHAEKNNLSWKELLTKLSGDNRAKATELINQLYTIANESNKVINTNYQVISHNINQLQDLWKNLMLCKTKDNGVYTQNGVMT